MGLWTVALNKIYQRKKKRENWSVTKIRLLNYKSGFIFTIEDIRRQSAKPWFYDYYLYWPTAHL